MIEAVRKQDHIDDEAAEWAARLGGPALNLAEERALERWLGRDSRHGDALCEAQAAWRVMGALRHDPGALALDVVSPRKDAAPSRRVPARWLQAGALAACVLLAAVWAGDSAVMLAADHRTGAGEQRDIQLPDGSQVTLGPDSAVDVRFDDRERRVELLSGIAYFTAAPKTGTERRPFVVAAADGTACALGTQFMVNFLDKAVEVTVAEHEVEVTAAGEHVFLSPGQVARYSGAGVENVAPVGVDMAAAWRSGTLVFDHRPLGEVITQLNRYRHDRIVIADPALGHRTVSGVFETNDPEATLATIAKVLEIHRVSLPRLVTILY